MAFLTLSTTRKYDVDNGFIVPSKVSLSAQMFVPEEIIIRIFRYLSSKELAIVECVDHKFQTLSNDTSLSLYRFKVSPEGLQLVSHLSELRIAKVKLQKMDDCSNECKTISNVALKGVKFSSYALGAGTTFHVGSLILSGTPLVPVAVVGFLGYGGARLMYAIYKGFSEVVNEDWPAENKELASRIKMEMKRCPKLSFEFAKKRVEDEIKWEKAKRAAKAEENSPSRDHYY